MGEKSLTRSVRTQAHVYANGSWAGWTLRVGRKRDGSVSYFDLRRRLTSKRRVAKTERFAREAPGLLEVGESNRSKHDTQDFYARL